MEKTHYSPGSISTIMHMSKLKKRKEKEAKPTLDQIKVLVCAGVSPSPPSEIKFSGTLPVGHWKAKGNNRN